MNLELIYNGSATLEDLMQLYKLGFDVVIESGKVAHIYQEGSVISGE